MLLQLNALHHENVLTLFGDRNKEYGFLLDELKSNEYKNPNVKVYGEFLNEKLVSILVHNWTNITYYANEERDIGIYSSVLSSATFKKISGEYHIIDPFIHRVTVKKDISSHLGYVDEMHTVPKKVNVGLAHTKEEFGQIFHIMHTIKEFSDVVLDTKERFVNNQLNSLKDKVNRTYYIKVNGMIVASATTVYEHRSSVILTGVFTHLDYRGKGCAHDLLTALADKLLNQGKVLYFFYNNPKARSLYKKIGLKEVGKWRVLHV